MLRPASADKCRNEEISEGGNRPPGHAPMADSAATSLDGQRCATLSWRRIRQTQQCAERCFAKSFAG